MTGHRREVQITNKRGLHARASAKFVTLASGLPCEILVEKDGQSVTGTSIMGLMMLGAAKGDNITISAAGEQAAHAYEQLALLVEKHYGEDKGGLNLSREITGFYNTPVQRDRSLCEKRHRQRECLFR